MKVDIVDNAIPAAAEGAIDDTKPMSVDTLAYLADRGDLWDEDSLRKLVNEVLVEREWVDVKGYTRPEFFFGDRERIANEEAGVVLLDWDTGMDGAEALDRTLKERPRDGVFIVTGFDTGSRITQEVAQRFSSSISRIALFRKGEGSVSFLRMVAKFYEMVEAGIILAKRRGTRDEANGQDKPREGELLRVWYATNRRPITEDPLTFSSKREASLRYGRAYVRVLPRTHIPSGWNPLRRFRLNSSRTSFSHFDPIPKDDFYALINADSERRDKDAREFLLFIHGFDVSFQNAIESVAQIAYDIRFPGQIGAFSWPSLGEQSKGAYMADKEVALNSVDVLGEFLTELVAQKSLSRIHIVAHSMGNFLCLQALDRLLVKGYGFDSPFAQFVLMAADVETDWFLQHNFSAVADRITVYSSKQDWALELSREYQQVPRLGLIPPMTFVADCDSIDASVCKTPFLGAGHDYYAESTRLLGDFTLVLQGHPVDKRPALQRHDLKEGYYWELQPMT
jgi:esterase/lipase superfamily enzyme